MKKIVIIAFLVLVAYAPKLQAQAKITFKTETVDYGEIAKNSDGVRVFEFTNTGDAPLIITEVKSSCGCTVPKKPENPIAPGESDVIEVKYATNRVGPIRKTITVTSNAETKIVALKIKGKVLAEEKSVLEKTK